MEDHSDTFNIWRSITNGGKILPKVSTFKAIVFWKQIRCGDLSYSKEEKN